MTSQPPLFQFQSPAFEHPKLEKRLGPKEIPGRYIVLLKANAISQEKKDTFPDKEVFPSPLGDLIHLPGVHRQLPGHHLKFLNAWAGTIKDGRDLQQVLESPHVEFVYHDGLAKTQETHSQPDAPWGISRLSSPQKLGGSNALKSNFTYSYQDAVNNVFVYVVGDPLVYFKLCWAHELQESTPVMMNSRDAWNIFDIFTDGWSLFGPDTHGHGTHCAGIIAGNRFGVAKQCQIINVSVMDATGACPFSKLLTALNIVHDDAAQRISDDNGKFIGVVNLSLGSPRSKLIDDAVQKLIDLGLHVVAAASNQNNDAQYYSPAGVESVITVGASTFTDSRAWFSNQGSLVDVYAPGVFINSATFNPIHPNDTELKSGTSQACAHVSGLVAYLLGNMNDNVDPHKMKEFIINLSTEDALTDIALGSNNRLANFSKLE